MIGRIAVGILIGLIVFGLSVVLLLSNGFEKDDAELIVPAVVAVLMVYCAASGVYILVMHGLL